MLVKDTPVVASALVETKTCAPTAMTTLFPLAGATSTAPAPVKEPMMRHEPPLLWLCHRFWLPLT